MWPLSAAHLCAALTTFLPLTPESSQPVFTGSVTVDSTFVSTQDTVMAGKAGWPVFGADYDAVIGTLHKAARVADIKWLKYFISDWWNTRVWLNTDASWQPSEPRQYYETMANAYLLLRDTGSRQTNFDLSALSDNYAYLSPNYNTTGNWTMPGDLTPAYTPDQFVYNTRGHSKAVAALWYFNVVYAPSTVTNSVTHTVWAERWLARMFDTSFFQSGQYWVTFQYGEANYGDLEIGAYQQALMCRAIIGLCNVLPASALKTTALTNVSANLLFMRTELAELSLGGTPQLIYFTEPPLFPPKPDLDEARNSVDLNGFFTALFAWRAWYASSVADANYARTLYETIGFTPRDGQEGPFIGNAGFQKQQQESFFMSQATHYYLKLAGL